MKSLNQPSLSSRLLGGGECTNSREYILEGKMPKRYGETKAPAVALIVLASPSPLNPLTPLPPIPPPSAEVLLDLVAVIPLLVSLELFVGKCGIC